MKRYYGLALIGLVAVSIMIMRMPVLKETLRSAMQWVHNDQEREKWAEIAKQIDATNVVNKALVGRVQSAIECESPNKSPVWAREQIYESSEPNCDVVAKKHGMHMRFCAIGPKVQAESGSVFDTRFLYLTKYDDKDICSTLDLFIVLNPAQIEFSGYTAAMEDLMAKYHLTRMGLSQLIKVQKMKLTGNLLEMTFDPVFRGMRVLSPTGSFQDFDFQNNFASEDEMMAMIFRYQFMNHLFNEGTGLEASPDLERFAVCTQDAQCVLTNAFCGDIAVNRNKLNEFKNKIGPPTVCAATTKCQRAMCFENKCHRYVCGTSNI